MTKPMLKEKPREKYWLVFLLALGVATAFFLPYLIADKGYFLFYGDFNVQQVPFYQRAHDLVRQGALWDYGTDLGVNFIGSYSFYLLGSPFFWLTIPFPSWMVPHLMGPLLILKFGCAALTSYCYISRFVKNKDLAVLGGLLYAFSGFSVYNVFFNHFHEAIILFPLLLLSMEQFMVDHRRGFFLVMVALCAVSNYFFFFGMVIFCVIYWFVRMASGDWKPQFSTFFLLVLEAVLGLLLSAFILLPTLVTVLSNSRVSSMINGWGGLLYGKEQIYAYILQCFFFPPELPARPVFFTGADVKWSSVAGWMPLFSMSGVIAWLIAKRKTWQRRLIIIMIVMAMIPFLNSAFYLFNYAYYARWFYMPILIMALVSAQGLEDEEVNYAQGLRWTTGITLAFTLAIGFFPTGTEDGNFWDKFGLFDKSYTNRFMMWVVIALTCLLVMALLLRIRKWDVKKFAQTSIAAVCAVSIVYSALFIGLGKSHSYETTNYIIPDLLESDIQMPDKQQVRWDVYDGMDNVGMFFNVPCIQAFHSLVPASVTEFYEYVGVERGVGSRPETSNYPLRSLLSVKYLLDYTGDGSEFQSGTTVMPYYSYKEKQGNYAIYENDAFIPYGFTYDYYMSKDLCDSYSGVDRQMLMLKAMMLSDDQIAEYGHLFACNIKNKDSSKDPLYLPEGEDVSEEVLEEEPVSPVEIPAEENDDTEEEWEDAEEFSQMTEPSSFLELTETAYFKDCQDRAATAAQKTVFSNNSFTSEITLAKDNLVFYSVPYEEGWSAQVDGKEAKIEQVNVGFMAVLVPAGNHTVTFTYRTPYLNEGILVTLVTAVLAGIYLLIVFCYRKKHPLPAVCEPVNEIDGGEIISKEAMQILGQLQGGEPAPSVVQEETPAEPIQASAVTPETPEESKALSPGEEAWVPILSPDEDPKKK